MRNCRHETGYCLKRVIEGQPKIYVDDCGCAKCDGNPPMPKPLPSVEQTKEQEYFEMCQTICKQCEKCPVAKMLCRAGHRGYSCELNKWPDRR